MNEFAQETIEDPLEARRIRNDWWLLRRFWVISLAALPFSFGGHGPVSAAAFAIAFSMGCILLGAMMLSWRRRNQFWKAIPLVAFVIVSKVTNGILENLPASWLVIIICLTVSLPLWIFEARVIRLCRIEELLDGVKK